jgi:hypothetical protein
MAKQAHISKPDAKRLHVERMLARARRRAKQAAKLVEKWEKRLAETNRSEVAAKQASLWDEAERATRSEAFAVEAGL